MKAVLLVVLIAFAGYAAAQTKCESIMAKIAEYNTALPDEQKINNATAFLTQVVGAAVQGLQADATTGVKTSLYRYFNGTGAPYPNIFRDGTAAGLLVNKLISWFSGYLQCVGTTPAPATNLDLYESHKHLKISKSDALLFNTVVVNAIGGVLASQNVPLDGSDVAVLGLAAQVITDLDNLVPSYTINATVASFCDKYANILTGSGYQTNFSVSGYGSVSFASLGEDAAEYTANVAARGPGYAFWFFFIKRGVVLNELVGNNTVNARLGVYFNGSRTAINFFNNGAALDTLIKKLTAWFGVLTGCSDAEFRGWAQSTGAVSAAGPIDLTASHQGLRITAADNDLFNTAILRQAVGFLGPRGLTNDEGTVVAGLLNSVATQVVYQPPAPAAAPTAAAVPSAGAAPTAPKAPVAKAPSAAGSVVASIGLVAVALLALLF